MSASTSNERTPLLNSQPPAEPSSIDEAQLAEESAFSAFKDATHGVDPNSSAFMPPDSHLSVPMAGEQAAGEGHSLAELLLIMSAMWIGTFLSALDSTIVATILGTVGAEFDVSRTVGWLGTSYLLTQTAFQPLYGRLSDIFGRKAATLFASTVFLIGSLLCGLSRTFTQLCIARGIAGVGGGGLTSMATIVTSDLVSLKARGTWQGLGNLVYAAGAAMGGPLGGVLADGGVGWRWAFLVQVPLCLLHFIVVSIKVNIPAGPGNMIEKLRRVDVFGALTLVSAVAMLLVGLSLGGNELPWANPIVVVTLVGGLAIFGAFVAVEKYVAREPLMPLSVLFHKTPGFVSLACFFISVSQFGIMYNVPLYFTAVAASSAANAGLHLIPNAVTASACSLGSGLIMGRTGKYRAIMLFGGFCGVFGPMCMYLWHGTRTWDAWYWFTMPWGGAGFGSTLTITCVFSGALLMQPGSAHCVGRPARHGAGYWCHLLVPRRWLGAGYFTVEHDSAEWSELLFPLGAHSGGDCRRHPPERVDDRQAARQAVRARGACVRQRDARCIPVDPTYGCRGDGLSVLYRREAPAGACAQAAPRQCGGMT